MRREAHCTYRAMRRLLFGGEQKETAMPFPTSKCGRPGGRPVCARGRGAHRRRNKGLRGEKHHAGLEKLAFEPGGVVLVDEGTRVCGERSTTPSRWKAGSCLGAWCPSTKEQGFAGSEAPRRSQQRTRPTHRVRSRPGPTPLRRRMASKSGAATAAPRHHNSFR